MSQQTFINLSSWPLGWNWISSFLPFEHNWATYRHSLFWQIIISFWGGQEKSSPKLAQKRLQWEKVKDNSNLKVDWWNWKRGRQVNCLYEPSRLLRCWDELGWLRWVPKKARCRLPKHAIYQIWNCPSTDALRQSQREVGDKHVKRWWRYSVRYCWERA